MDFKLERTTHGFDLALTETDLAIERGIDSLVIASLGFERRLVDSDEAPGERFYRGGSVLDHYMGRALGSRLWLLRNAKVTDETIRAARDYAKEALEWMVEEDHASNVSAQAERHGRRGILIGIVIDRPTRGKYLSLWSDLTEWRGSWSLEEGGLLQAD